MVGGGGGWSGGKRLVGWRWEIDQCLLMVVVVVMAMVVVVVVLNRCLLAVLVFG